MTETSQLPLPPPGAGLTRSGPAVGLALLAFAAVVLGSVLLGVVVGFAWAAIAPRALLVVVSRGSADVVNPETSAFIAADGWFTLLCLIGGVVSGLLGYLFAVRRHGAFAMLGVLGGGLAAAFIARWIGQGSGVAAFNRRLAVSKPGVLLRAPLVLGAHGALAFWPLAAGAIAGSMEAVVLLRERRRSPARRAVRWPTRGYGPAVAATGAARPPGSAEPPVQAGLQADAVQADQPDSAAAGTGLQADAVQADQPDPAAAGTSPQADAAVQADSQAPRSDASD
jgi:hypothetical protein